MGSFTIALHHPDQLPNAGTASDFHALAERSAGQRLGRSLDSSYVDAKLMCHGNDFLAVLDRVDGIQVTRPLQERVQSCARRALEGRCPDRSYLFQPKTDFCSQLSVVAYRRFCEENDSHKVGRLAMQPLGADYFVRRKPPWAYRSGQLHDRPLLRQVDRSEQLFASASGENRAKCPARKRRRRSRFPRSRSRTRSRDSRKRKYADTEAAMQNLPMDFVQLDYSIGDRIPEERLLPLAREKGIAVLANRPFTTGNLFARVRGKALPDWAAEFDCTSWAQFFLKFVVSHPAVTCAIPATNDPEHLRDNMGACFGRLPDERMRARMAEFFAGL